ncbi:hypothetical protein Nepgr_015784 [Nepenthes gracilis]|uniref:Uncharacterized protein n=1 Tax=Nepenthes gracilis TaxID=150966 RepID=A0AAD3SMC4_NEPGR|nr:hypothetical protein Nepgr_015784 [Nepenthes gracilis]
MTTRIAAMLHLGVGGLALGAGGSLSYRFVPLCSNYRSRMLIGSLAVFCLVTAIHEGHDICLACCGRCTLYSLETRCPLFNALALIRKFRLGCALREWIELCGDLKSFYTVLVNIAGFGLGYMLALELKEMQLLYGLMLMLAGRQQRLGVIGTC